MMLRFALLVSLLELVSSASIPATNSGLTSNHNHHETLPIRRGSESWHQPRNHFVHRLFARGPEPAGFPVIGTPEWSDGFPDNTPGEIANIPQEWKAALDKAVAENKIPSIPPSAPGGIYPPGLDPMSDAVCSSTAKCRLDEDLWDAPDGVFASSFDDGPLPDTPRLIDFLEDHNVTTTHFMIGWNIITHPEEFKAVVESDGDLAVHTWSHRYMTSLSNEEVVGELGWTMQAIYNSTGRVPKFWRPPYGDSDTRVSAIAREIFGLTTVIWNHDTDDWKVGSPGGPPLEEAEANLGRFLQSPKSPGLMVLEHESSENTVNIFLNGFPAIAANGWKFESLASAYDNRPTYSNDMEINVLFGDVQSSTASSSTPTSTAATNVNSAPSATSASPSQGSSGSSSTNAASRLPSLSSTTLMLPLLLVLAWH